MGAGTGLGERVVEGKHSSGHLDRSALLQGGTPPDHPSRPPRRAPNTLPWEKGGALLCSTLQSLPPRKFWICRRSFLLPHSQVRRDAAPIEHHFPRWEPTSLPVSGNHTNRLTGRNAATPGCAHILRRKPSTDSHLHTWPHHNSQIRHPGHPGGLGPPFVPLIPWRLTYIAGQYF